MVVLENRDLSHTYIRPSSCICNRCSTSSQFKISYHPQLSTIIEENEQEDHPQNSQDERHKVASYSFRSSSSVESIALFHHEDHGKYSRSMASLPFGLSTMIEATSSVSTKSASTTSSFPWDDASSLYSCIEERRSEDSLFSWGLYIEDIETP
jgi:hypothetical protein